ncbi:hypothetical protein M595_0649 [Lyngbya aestuarii BL J]|uniref:Uncharacterized protein n=1 Tax=Lyngbya aestuarii BL J TaxID=1348334 RepID=U7QN55_9CYAN|nr:hypothetical protein M595_0649 [Lyngbya aestuarii BL J]
MYNSSQLNLHQSPFNVGLLITLPPEPDHAKLCQRINKKD